MIKARTADRKISPSLLVLVLYIALLFLLGGGSRDDIQSLAILRPLTFVFLAFGLWQLSRDNIRRNSALFAIMLAAMTITALQLVPLPPSIWQAFPGRELVVELDNNVGNGDIWRPLSLVPSATLNAFFSLTIPFTMLVLACGLRHDEMKRLLPCIIGIAMLSAVIGLLQIIGPEKGPLYFYRITNHGNAVGLFSNRNHQAVFLASIIPMLAFFASQTEKASAAGDFKRWFAVACVIFLIPLILVTGSRAGLILGFVGIISAPFIYRYSSGARQEHSNSKSTLSLKTFATGGAMLFILIAVTLLMSRAEAFERLISHDESSGLRVHIWKPSMELVVKYFPIGSGFGTFPQVFQIDEPNDLLNLNYVNHVHNDWIELPLTGGLPVIALMALALGIIGKRVYQLIVSRKNGLDNGVARLSLVGVVVIFMFLVASIVDYPLRTPSLSGLFMLALIWLFYDNNVTGKRKLTA